MEKIARGSQRSKIVRLREMFDKLEAIKKQGATNKEIVEGLKKHGLIFDVPNFKNARSRILKERAMEALTRPAPFVNEGEPTCPPITKTPSTSAPAVSAPEVSAPEVSATAIAAKEAVVDPATRSSGKRPSILKKDVSLFSGLNPAPSD